MFVATGGAGIVMSKNVIEDVLKALADLSISGAGDVIIHRCLLGRIEGLCNSCKHAPDQRALTVSQLIFSHLGTSSSRSVKYYQTDPKWICGTRSVMTLFPTFVLPTDMVWKPRL
jgi:hypothetical protein